MIAVDTSVVVAAFASWHEGHALIQRNADPSEEDVRWAIAGNLCRCTGYMNIVDSIRAAAAAGGAG